MIQPNFEVAAPKSDSIGTKGYSAATTQNAQDVTGMRSSARSAVSTDVRDNLQPVDLAERAAMAREGMLQPGCGSSWLWLSRHFGQTRATRGS